MVRITGVIGSFAVDNIEAAKHFYQGTLELEAKSALPGEAGPLWVGAGEGPRVFVYGKPDHAPASFTVLNLAVEDIEAAVDDLVERGITFLRLEGIPQDERGIYHGPGHSIAWFSDPAGNSLAVVKLSPVEA
ncbi:MAG: VOC family protein [Candidatus Limnocylindria bacterium]